MIHTNVGAFDGRLWCPKPQSDVLVPSSSTLSHFRALAPDPLCFGIREDVWLFLVGALGLNGQFGRHDCSCYIQVVPMDRCLILLVIVGCQASRLLVAGALGWLTLALFTSEDAASSPTRLTTSSIDYQPTPWAAHHGKHGEP